MQINDIKQAVITATEELILKGALKKGAMVVIGCSTSEVGGGVIGKSGSLEIAEAVLTVPMRF